MSNFTAINISDDELDIEQHTRELQIEVALETLNKALSLQKVKNYTDANEKYIELSKIEILNSKNISNNPTINQLKYLFFRNRGILKLHELLDSKSDFGLPEGEEEKEEEGSNGETNSNILFNKFLSSILDLINAIQFGDPDIKLLELLSTLFSYYNQTRIARLCYELKISQSKSNSQNDEFKWELTRPTLLLPNQIFIMENYIKLLNNLHDNTPKLYESITKVLKKINSIGNNKYNPKLIDWDKIISVKDWNNSREKNSVNELVIDVGVRNGKIDIDQLFDSLAEILPKPKGRAKVFDGYILTDKMVDNVKFKFDLIDIDTEIVEIDDDDIEIVDVNAVDTIQTQKHDVSVTFPDKTNMNEANDVTDDKVIIKNHEVAVSNNIPKMDDEKDNDSTTVEISNNIDIDEAPEPELTTAQRIAAKRITRSRLDVESEEINQNIFETQDIFLTETVPSYFKLCDINISIESFSNIVISDSPLRGSDLNVDIRLINLIASFPVWNDLQTEAIMVSLENRGKRTENDKESSIKEILNSSTMRNSIDVKVRLGELDNNGLYNFLSSFKNKKLHLNQVRFKLLEHLFTLNDSGSTLLTNGFVSKETLKNIKLIVDSLDVNLYKMFKDFIFSDDYNNALSLVTNLNISISICEILIESYLSIKQEQKLKKLTNKSAINEYQTSETILYNRIRKWQQAIDDLFDIINDFKSNPKDEVLIKLWARYNWSKICFLQHQPNFDTSELANILKELSNIVQDLNLDIQMVNYEFIPKLNKRFIDVQFSKLKILETFAKHDDSNEILENILLGRKMDDNNNYKITKDPSRLKVAKEMETFVKNSTVDLKLRLWSILFTSYEEKNDLSSYQTGFEKVVHSMLEEISLENLLKLSPLQSNLTVLRIIGFFGLFAKKFVIFLSKHNFKLVKDASNLKDIKQTLISLTTYFQFLYSFLMYQDITKLVNTKKSLWESSAKSYDKLCETTVYCFTLISVYYENSLMNPKPESVNDFFSILHTQLGLRHICNLAGGIFLKFVQHRLCELLWQFSDNDIFQIISCRFGIPISIENYESFDHKCKSNKMTIDDAIEISKYIIPYCYKKKHPILNPPKSDIKNVLDMILDVITEPNFKDSIVSSNINEVRTYLSDTAIDVDFIDDAFKGNVTLNISKPDFCGIEAANEGLYFIEGLIALHNFRIRKRAMQGRSAELDFVIKMLQADIICGSNRFESWLLLGQTYSFLVEDDLIWTSDKLNNDEKKRNTAFMQKRALLCYFMAINIYNSLPILTKNQIDSQILLMLWSLFAKELYNVWMEPLSKLALHVSPKENTYSLLANTNIEIFSRDLLMNIENNNLPSNVIYKLLVLSFKRATELNDSNWYNFMYLAKSQGKLRNQDLNVEEILDNLLKSCELAVKSSSKDDPVIEPHYVLCSTVYKFVKKGKLDEGRAIEVLKKDSIFYRIFNSNNRDKEYEEDEEGEEDVVEELGSPDAGNKDNEKFKIKLINKDDNNSFLQIIIKLLKRIMHYDKKNWQHRPKYRLAKIYYEDFGDFKKSEIEMSSLISLRPHVRSLSTIWKSENERAGKHFVYNCEYINFYITLLNRSHDVYSLTQLIKKLRKLGSSMINQTKTFDNAILRTCILIKKIIKIPPGFLDEAITKMVYNDFIQYSKEFIDYNKNKEDFSHVELLTLYFLNEVHGFRRMANGFGATGIIDECYHSLYLMLFIPFINEKLASKSEVNDEISPLNASSIEQKLEIIGNLSSTKGQNTPTREKVRVARRDVTPYSGQLLSSVHKVIDRIKRQFNDGSPLSFEIEENDEEIDDAVEIERMLTGVIVKETKENKEEKELEKLLSGHDRNLTEDELLKINNILEKFKIEKLKNFISVESPIESNERTPVIESKPIVDDPMDVEVPFEGFRFMQWSPTINEKTGYVISAKETLISDESGIYNDNNDNDENDDNDDIQNNDDNDDNDDSAHNDDNDDNNDNANNVNSVDNSDIVDIVVNVDSVENIDNVDNAGSIANADIIGIDDNAKIVDIVNKIDSGNNVDSIDTKYIIDNVNNIDNDKVENFDNIDSVDNFHNIENVDKMDNDGNIGSVDSVNDVDNADEVDDVHDVVSVDSDDNADIVDVVDNVNSVNNVDNIDSNDSIDKVDADSIDNVESADKIDNTDNVDNAGHAEGSKEFQDFTLCAGEVAESGKGDSKTDPQKVIEFEDSIESEIYEVRKTSENEDQCMQDECNTVSENNPAKIVLLNNKRNFSESLKTINDKASQSKLTEFFKLSPKRIIKACELKKSFDLDDLKPGIQETLTKKRKVRLDENKNVNDSSDEGSFVDAHSSPVHFTGDEITNSPVKISRLIKDKKMLPKREEGEIDSSNKEVSVVSIFEITSSPIIKPVKRVEMDINSPSSIKKNNMKEPSLDLASKPAPRSSKKRRSSVIINRRSRANSAKPVLMELGHDGGAKRQKNIKLEREKKLRAKAEYIESSDDNGNNKSGEDDVIEIL